MAAVLDCVRIFSYMGMGILAWNKNSLQYVGLIFSLAGSLMPILGLVSYFVVRYLILTRVGSIR
jgi:hypothetical protein